MDTSKFLARVIGIYMLIISVGFLINIKELTGHVQNMINNPELMFVTGFFTLIIGILLVVSHNIWECNWKVIITIIAWIVLLKGASLVFYPRFLDTITEEFVRNPTMAYVCLIIDLIIALVLIYFGFRTNEIHKKRGIFSSKS